jgi:thiamine biosynthesis lipoprotein
MSIRRTHCYGQCLALIVLVLALELGRADWYQENQPMMGTMVSVDLWSEDAAEGQRLVVEVMDEYRRIDALMSTYKADSELSAINRQASGQAVMLGAELYGLIDRALELAVASHGAFDITYESVGYLYDFRARQRPAEATIAAHLTAIDYRAVELTPDPRRIRFGKSGMRLNLGGIAKGYAIERGAVILRAAGIQHAVLNAGGDTRVVGDRRGQPWIVGIRNPRNEASVVTRLPLVDEAISTSGDYERFFLEGGVRFHHIINPATGTPSEGVRSATVIGPDGTTTDALSTALFVMGVERGLGLIHTLPAYEAVMVDADGKLFYSDGLTVPEG